MARSEIETGAVWVNTSHPSPAQKPPTSEAGVIGWLRSNLFSSVFNSILTVLSAIALYYIIGGFVRWVFFDAFWEPVWVNRKLITVGTYPAAQLWQPATLLAIVSVLFGLSGGRWGGIMRSLTMGVAALLLLFAVLPVGMQAQIYLGIGLALLLVSYVIGLAWRSRALADDRLVLEHSGGADPAQRRRRSTFAGLRLLLCAVGAGKRLRWAVAHHLVDGGRHHVQLPIGAGPGARTAQFVAGDQIFLCGLH
ncbi:MAG: hypothetical protein R2856_06685 [Caldilineaceae bacterium]